MTEVSMTVCSLSALQALEQSTNPNSLEAPNMAAFKFDQTNVLLTASDDGSGPRVFILQQDVGYPIIPREFRGSESKFVSRMRGFVQRIHDTERNIPDNWSPYFEKDMISFTAASGDRHLGRRWICQVDFSESPVVIFREITTADKRLETVSYPSINEGGWAVLWDQLNLKFQDALVRLRSDDPVELDHLPSPHGSPLSFPLWKEKLTSQQRDFVNLPKNKSVRLKGPAGSGKSVALALRAFNHANAPAVPDNREERFLVVTHSWASAYDITSIIEGCGLGPLNNVDVLPLLDLAREIVPPEYVGIDGYNLLSTDSAEAVTLQLHEVEDALEAFESTDWPTFRNRCSRPFADRIDSKNPVERAGLVWDLSVEFGSVLGAAKIVPGLFGLDKYKALARGAWMMKLDESTDDLRSVYEIYKIYTDSLDSRKIIALDQFYSDCLGYLETSAWNRKRKTMGYDVILIDEYHLYTPMERMVLQNVSREADRYPVVCTASDPTQSASIYFSHLTADSHSRSDNLDLKLGGNEESIEFTNVHRFNQQILDFIKHLDSSFPLLDLPSFGGNMRSVTSTKTDGDKPVLMTFQTLDDEIGYFDRFIAHVQSGTSTAIIVLDEHAWPAVVTWASKEHNRKRVLVIDSASDVERLQYSSSQVAVLHSESVPGLQFDNVLVTGFPPSERISSASSTSIFLSRLYLASSRAKNDLHLFMNYQADGLADIVASAVEKNFISTG